MPDAAAPLDPDRPTAEGFRPAGTGLRRRLFEIVFHADDPVGKAFDITLIVAILASVFVVMVESVATVQYEYAWELYLVEWFFTVLFTVEYGLRLAVLKNPGRYARSFFGVVDLLAILPTYLSLFVPGAQVLLTVRILRVLRVFRVLKLANYLDEAQTLRRALTASRRKILVFMFAVVTLVTVVGSMMYLVETEANPDFSSIPQSVYWAIVTVSTVGFGDMVPVTPTGKALASVLIIMGYGIIAVPTGIVTVELGREQQERRAEQEAERAARRAPCSRCGLADHDADAAFCKRCGTELVAEASPAGAPTG